MSTPRGPFQYCSFPQMSATENTKLLFRSLRNNLPLRHQRAGAVGRQWLLDQLASRDSASSHGQARCVVWVLLPQPALIIATGFNFYYHVLIIYNNRFIIAFSYVHIFPSLFTVLPSLVPYCSCYPFPFPQSSFYFPVSCLFLSHPLATFNRI